MNNPFMGLALLMSLALNVSSAIFKSEIRCVRNYTQCQKFQIADSFFVFYIMLALVSSYLITASFSTIFLNPLAQRSSVNGFPQSRIDIAESEPRGSAQDAEIAKEH